MFNFKGQRSLSDIELAILMLVAFVIVVYMGITTFMLWLHAGLIWKFVVANLFLFITNRLMLAAQDARHKDKERQQ